MAIIPVLNIFFPDGRSETYTIQKEKIIIGRALDCDVVLNYPNVSRNHAFIERNGDLYIIKNITENNVVKVNDSDIKENTLSSGAVILIGNVKIKFVLPIKSDNESETILSGAIGKDKAPEEMATVLASSSIEGEEKGKTLLLSDDKLLKDILIANLKIRQVKKADKDLLFDKPILTIGRDATNDLVIDDPYISRKMVELSYNPEKRRHYLEHLGGENPIKVNDVKVDKPVLLKNSDRIQLGRTIIIYQELVQEDAKKGVITVVKVVDKKAFAAKCVGICVGIIAIFIIWAAATHQSFLRNVPGFKGMFRQEILLEEIEKFKENNEFDKAIAGYEKFLKEFPDTNMKKSIREKTADCYYFIGRVLIEKGEFTKAREQFDLLINKFQNEDAAIVDKAKRAIIESFEKEFASLFKEGEKLLSENEFDKAKNTFAELEKRFKDTNEEMSQRASKFVVKAFSKEADKARKEGDYEKYKSILSKLIEQYPDSPEAQLAKEELKNADKKKALTEKLKRCIDEGKYISPASDNIVKYYNDYKQSFADDNSADSIIEEARAKMLKDIEQAKKDKNVPKLIKIYEDIYLKFEENFKNDTDLYLEKSEAYKEIGLLAKKQNLTDTAKKYLTKADELKSGKDEEIKKALNDLKTDEKEWFK